MKPDFKAMKYGNGILGAIDAIHFKVLNRHLPGREQKAPQVIPELDLVEDQFIEELLSELTEDKIIDRDHPASFKDLKGIVNTALGAKIDTEKDVYEFSELCIRHQVLFKRPFPDWARNILYTEATPESKILAIRYWLEPKVAEAERLKHEAEYLKKERNSQLAGILIFIFGLFLILFLQGKGYNLIRTSSSRGRSSGDDSSSGGGSSGGGGASNSW